MRRTIKKTIKREKIPPRLKFAKRMCVTFDYKMNPSTKPYIHNALICNPWLHLQFLIYPSSLSATWETKWGYSNFNPSLSYF